MVIVFKHNVNNKAQYIYNNIISSIENVINYYAVSHAIFSSPQVAAVGLREQDLKNMSINYYKSGGTIDSISGTIHIHIHPALSEVVARAAGV